MNNDHMCYRWELEGLLKLLETYPTDRRLMYEHSVVSPMDLVQRERHLQLLRTEAELGSPIACDALVFAYGEAESRYVTKVGGLPYWPADLPWPKSAHGDPLEFVAQFNFAHSADILPALPGDVLSVFAETRGYYERTFHCSWHDVQTVVDLIAADRIPEVARPMVADSVYAVTCRISEYALQTPRKASSTVDDWPTVLAIRGGKIGGVPHYFSEQPPKVGGRFLCALHSLRHPTEIPWPFANVEEPLTRDMIDGGSLTHARGCYDTVMFGDQGTLYFFLQDDGNVQVILQDWGSK